MFSIPGDPELVRVHVDMCPAASRAACGAPYGSDPFMPVPTSWQKKKKTARRRRIRRRIRRRKKSRGTLTWQVGEGVTTKRYRTYYDPRPDMSLRLNMNSPHIPAELSRWHLFNLNKAFVSSNPTFKVKNC